MSIANIYTVAERKIVNRIHYLRYKASKSEQRILKSRQTLKVSKEEINVLIDEFDLIQEMKKPEKRIVLKTKKYVKV